MTSKLHRFCYNLQHSVSSSDLVLNVSNTPLANGQYDAGTAESHMLFIPFNVSSSTIHVKCCAICIIPVKTRYSLGLIFCKSPRFSLFRFRSVRREPGYGFSRAHLLLINYFSLRDERLLSTPQLPYEKFIKGWSSVALKPLCTSRVSMSSDQRHHPLLPTLASVMGMLVLTC